MSRKCYIVFSMHRDRRILSAFFDVENSDVFESITDGKNTLAIQLSEVENRLRGGQGDICPDGSRDIIIDYESTVGQRSVHLWSAKIATNLHLYVWRLHERNLEAPSDRARIANREFRRPGMVPRSRGNRPLLIALFKFTPQAPVPQPRSTASTSQHPPRSTASTSQHPPRSTASIPQTQLRSTATITQPRPSPTASVIQPQPRLTASVTQPQPQPRPMASMTKLPSMTLRDLPKRQCSGLLLEWKK